MAGIERATTREQTRWQRLRGRLMMAVLALSFVVGFLAVAALTLWRTWQTSDWAAFWVATVMVPLCLAFPLIIVLAARARLSRLAVGAMVLREAAASGDERLAPLAAQQPRPAGAPPPIGRLIFPRLLRTSSLHSSQFTPFIFLALLMFFIVP